jgi:ribosomal protein L31
MTTVIEEYTTEEQNFTVRSLGAKGLYVMDINQETFPVYDGKYLSRGGSQLGDKRFADDEEVQTEARK